MYVCDFFYSQVFVEIIMLIVSGKELKIIALAQAPPRSLYNTQSRPRCGRSTFVVGLNVPIIKNTKVLLIYLLSSKLNFSDNRLFSY